MNNRVIELYSSPDKCCACGACVSVCPRQAIQFLPDEKGFLFPQIDEGRCIECRQCLDVCIYKNSGRNVSEKVTYAAAAEGIDISRSASGGIFASIAKHVIKNGGIVFGCTMEYENSEFIPRHIGIEESDQIWRLQGSKYVQSSVEMTFQRVREALDAKKTVLYSGTPCQIGALRLFLGRHYDRLFTIDTICHGVPSVKFFNDYIAFENKKRHGQITGFDFRDKSEGWKLHGKMTIAKDGRIGTLHFEPEESSYYQMFLNGYTYRDSCYSCQYASDNRPGDITIGDYWCIDLVHPEFLSENGGQLEQTAGVSCLIVNSSHGRRLMEEYGREIHMWKSTYENVARYNKQLLHPSKMPAEREEVFSRYKDGYAAVDKWYRKRQRPIQMRRAAKKLIPKDVKQTIKKLVKK